MQNLSSRFIVLTLGLALVQTAAAAPGDGITNGRLSLGPYLDTSMSYESDVRPTEEEVTEPDPDGMESRTRDESDTSVEVQLGTSIHLDAGNWTLGGAAWGFVRRYQEDDVDDEEGFGEQLTLSSGDRERLAWSIFQSYERRFDFRQDALTLDPAAPSSPLPVTNPARDIDLDDDLLRVRTEQDQFSFGADAGRILGRHHEVDVGYEYHQTDYQSEERFDDASHFASLNVGRRLTTRTTAFLQGGYGEEDNDNYVDAVPYYQILVGLRSSALPKTSYNVGVGYQSADTADPLPTQRADGTVAPPAPRRNPVTGEEVADPTLDDTQTGFSYNVGVSWTPTQRLSFSLTGRNEISSSSSGDQREVNLGQLTAQYHPPGSISLSANVGYRDEMDVSPSLDFDEDGNEVRTKEGTESFIATGRITFTPPQRWYTAFASVSYEEVQSGLDDQSDDSVRIRAGLRLTY